MRLLFKFNLIFALVFVAGLLGCGYLTRELLQRNAQDEILENARLLMESSIAVRNYTSNQIKPLLETQMKYSFLPQSVPAYSATEGADRAGQEVPRVRLQGGDAEPDQPA